MRMFTDPVPPKPKGIDMRCCSVEELDLRDKEPDLVIADPPWTYTQKAVGNSVNEDHYPGLPIQEIVAHLEVLPGRRLALWITWPLLGEWPIRLRGWGTPKTGGAWTKSQPGDTGHYGQGYHWAGCSELVLIYTRQGSVTHRHHPLRNAWIETPGTHSRKPVGWQRGMIRRWTDPGGLVLDPYAGLGSVAEACLLEGRRYLGSEIDPERHRRAMGLLAGVRPLPRSMR